MQNFNIQTEIQELKRQTKLIRKRNYTASKSRLDKYKAEILSLKKYGASVSEIQRWLRDKRIKVAWSTIYRWLQKNG